jgi:UDPglucose 6-dehydrogenase
VAFAVVSNPEFLKEGAAVDDFMKPDRVVIGVDDEQADAADARALRSPSSATATACVLMDVRSGRAHPSTPPTRCWPPRISFMNELALLAERVGADIEQVRRGIGSDPRIGTHFLVRRLRLRRLAASPRT